MENTQQAEPASWLHYHGKSEDLASQAEKVAREGRPGAARERYAQAAAFEEQALGAVGIERTRTFGVTAISAASLWAKAGQLGRALDICRSALQRNELPQFAQLELTEISRLVARRTGRASP